MMLEYVKETRQAVRKTFKDLESKGWYTGTPSKEGIWCCGSCSWGNIPEDKDNAVFYHEQGEDTYKIWGMVHLYHKGNTSELVETLNDNGVITQWNGKSDRAVKVLGMMKHLDTFQDSEMDREGYGVNGRGNLYETR